MDRDGVVQIDLRPEGRGRWTWPLGLAAAGVAAALALALWSGLGPRPPSGGRPAGGEAQEPGAMSGGARPPRGARTGGAARPGDGDGAAPAAQGPPRGPGADVEPEGRDPDGQGGERDGLEILAPEVLAPAGQAPAGEERAGIALFPARGTKPIKAGIVVPDEFPLPPGYVRHYQTTDKGQMLEPILMFHPDHKPVGADGKPVPLPADRVVTAEMAPAGLPIKILDVPEDDVDDEEEGAPDTDP